MDRGVVVSARLSASVIVLVAACAGAALAETEFRLELPAPDAALSKTLSQVSLSREAAGNKEADAQDLFGAARADYARLIGALYDEGRYGGTVSILIDGREAATIAPMDAPAQIGKVEIRVDPGPVFRFSRATIGPLAPATQLPPSFRVTEVARSSAIVAAAGNGVSAWRDAGHAKAAVARQTITADHRNQELAAEIALDPGPQAWFGTLQMTGNERLRSARLAKIAGFPSGEVFSPAALEEVRNRLRRTGIFSAVTLTEADNLRDGRLLDGELTVVEAKLRRLGFGAEVSTSDGGKLSGYWLHRNLLGGGEKLRLDAEVSGVGVGSGGTDYSFGARLDRPATFSPDTAAFLKTEIAREHEDDYTLSGYGLSFGLSHIFSAKLSAEAGIGYEWAKIEDGAGELIYRQMTFPMSATWENRNLPADATRGTYAKLDLMPFYGLGTTGSGARLQGDFRAYRGFGANDRFVLAGRAQIGGVFGSDLAETPRDYLFYSGGGGTVRGQPYQALGVRELQGGTLHTGGTRFVGLSAELRAGVTEKIGVVAFYDAGYISASDFFGDGGDWHSGAGLGLRYKTPIGPIRLDVAAPVDGSTGDGPQLYLGIGQAF
ncbi:membrane protein [Rhodobacter capsulatus YW1]|nr:membrane protein [Rhodobacter capsulatus YW1]